MIYCTHAQSRNINYKAIDSQVRFHRRLFANPVKPYWYITKPVGPLLNSNQNWLGDKLLPMAVLIHPVVCVHPCHLLRTQHNCLCPNGRENPSSTCPPAPHQLPPIHTLIHDTCNIIGVIKTILKLAVNTAQQS